MLYNHGEGPYYGLLQVESVYQRFHISTGIRRDIGSLIHEGRVVWLEKLFTVPYDLCISCLIYVVLMRLFIKVS